MFIDEKTGCSNWGPGKTLMGCRLLIISVIHIENTFSGGGRGEDGRGGLAGGFYHQIVVILLGKSSFCLVFLHYDDERM